MGFEFYDEIKEPEWKHDKDIVVAGKKVGQTTVAETTPGTFRFHACIDLDEFQYGEPCTRWPAHHSPLVQGSGKNRDEAVAEAFKNSRAGALKYLRKLDTLHLEMFRDCKKDGE